MMRIYLILGLCLNIGISFAQALKPGISYTYISEVNQADRNIKYVETTINYNLTYEISAGHKLGLQYLHIKASGSSFTFSKNKSNYFLAGVFYQYDLMRNSRIDIFPEISINYGNYCTCGNRDPYGQNGMVYISYGFGIDLPIYKDLYLDTGFHFYQPSFNLEVDSKPYAYTQYILGLSYKFL